MAPVIARAEHLFGKVRGRADVLTLLCGLGLGAAMILDGRLIEGSSFPSSGIGNMPVTGLDGTVGTLEEQGSGFGVLRRLHGADMAPSGRPLPQLAKALRQAIERDRSGDPKVGASMAEAGRKLGRVVVQLAHFVRTESVLVAGPLSASPSYVEALRGTITEGMPSKRAEIVVSTFTGSIDGWSASSRLAIWEYLVERPSSLSSLGPPPPVRVDSARRPDGGLQRRTINSM